MSKSKYEKDLPILRGFLSENGKLIEVWCPYCKIYHAHGWDPAGKATQCRSPHCGDSAYMGTAAIPSKFSGSDYFIEPHPKKYLKKR